MRQLLERTTADRVKATKSIGDLARDGLKHAAGKDFGKDAPRWRRWVELHTS